ncbi:MAG: hypothetical protein GTO53_02020 [Planctomycetales bacterium]|nr:hypothetical protein [Planctomycetales bacterium]NIM07947.1 hypothetical protein [Planctomycetales bacterium]NIN07426.1 hypothetical protein [Planctomycetales bacterium]NIN76530.1 hypothetical protein [Planctomycetales bacterium]NIO33720.1 hypothetical protein [Planctomycetales bacterium]
MYHFPNWVIAWSALLLCLSGCHSPYYTDRAAVTGGLLGGGVGAVIGSHSGNSAEGALVGGALGTLTGAAVGNAFDEIDQRNRAVIAAQMGRFPQAGAVPLADVIAMTQSGVSDRMIITHIHTNGVAAPLSAQDLITLKQAGVSDAVTHALQTPRPQAALPANRPNGPPPVVIEEYGSGPWRRPRCPGCRPCELRPPPPGLSLGFVFRH